MVREAASSEEDRQEETSDASGAGREATQKEAETVFAHRGGLTEAQRKVLGVVAEATGPVTSTEIRQKTGLQQASFRGVMGVLPRRVRGALGNQHRNVELLNSRWVAENGEYEYWMPEAVRAAYLARF